MARHAFIPPALVFPSVNDDTLYRNNPLALRDTFRDGWIAPATEFNQALASPRWKCSDIGQYTSTYERGYYFILRDTTNGCEYLFCVAGRDASASPAEIPDFWGDTTGGNVHLQPTNIAPVSAGGTPYSRGGICVYYNPDYATSSFARAFGFDDTTNLTYTGGDFTAVSSSPLTTANLTTNWLPVGGVEYPKGFVFYNNAGQSDPVMYMFVIDDVKDTMAIFSAAGNSSSLLECNVIALLGGQVILPALVTDTRTQGGAWWTLAIDDGNLGTHTHAYAQGFSSAGTRIHDYALDPLNAFTYYNQANTLGDMKWRAVPITSASDTAKGHLNPDLAMEVGAYNDIASFLGTIYDFPAAATPMMKYTASMALMYAQSIPRFPFGFTGWGSTQQVTV